MTAGPVSGVSRRGGEGGPTLRAQQHCGSERLSRHSPRPGQRSAPCTHAHAQTQAQPFSRARRAPGGDGEAASAADPRCKFGSSSHFLSPSRGGPCMCNAFPHPSAAAQNCCLQGACGVSEASTAAARCSGCGVVVSPQDHRRGVASAGWQASPASGFCWSPCPVFIPHAPLVLSIFLIDSRLIFLPTFA